MEKRRTIKTALFIFFIIQSLLGRAWAAEEKLISMDFDNADIRVVIKFISELTSKNIVIDNRVKGNVTIISPRKITPQEAYKVFESILEVSNFSAVESAGVIKIIPKPEASKSLSSTRIGRESRRIPKDDKIITQIIPLQYAPSPNVKAALTPLVSKNGLMIDYPDTNILIVTDISSNIRRMVEIIGEIDVADIREKLEVIKLTYADAENLAKQLSSIFPLGKSAAVSARRRVAQPAATSSIKFISYSRTNSLIIVADEDEMERIKELIAMLDVQTEMEEGEIHVYYLQNSVAEDLAKVLNSMTQIKGKRPVPGAKGTATEMPITGNIAITPDKATNALVITASPRDFRVIKGVIEKLDIRRRQVYVEATIMEISLDKQRELGFEFRGTTDPATSTDVEVIGGSSFGGIEAASSNPLGLSGQGLVVGAVDGTIEWAGQTFYNIGALVRALETESGVNVLSTPHLLTTNNEEAEIIVGENVPFVTSRAQTTSGQPLETIERKDVGIKLKLTPQVNESDFVKLKIFQEISNVKETPLQGASDLITTKRSAETTIVAKDNQTVAIGGLIKDNEYDIASKVPCLGDIPLLGILFRYTEKRKEKTNLLIFLTPRIVRDAEGIEAITREKRENMDTFMEEKIAEEGDKEGQLKKEDVQTN